ncbi:hypothetical protein IT417_03830 [bacterium]|nr:hypothetical protein [bacterium]
MKKVLNALTTIIVFLFTVGLVHAQSAPPRFEELGGSLDAFFDMILPIGGLVATGMVVYGGYIWLISAGDSAKTNQARGTLTWAIGGLIFLFIFSWVLKLVFDFLGG